MSQPNTCFPTHAFWHLCTSSWVGQSQGRWVLVCEVLYSGKSKLAHKNGVFRKIWIPFSSNIWSILTLFTDKEKEWCGEWLVWLRWLHHILRVISHAPVQICQTKACVCFCHFCITIMILSVYIFNLHISIRQ